MPSWWLSLGLKDSTDSRWAYFGIEGMSGSVATWHEASSPPSLVLYVVTKAQRT